MAEIVSPRFVGEQFDGDGIPYEHLPNVSALCEAIVEVAKWKCREESPNGRLPAGFSESVSITFTGLDKGNSINPVIEIRPLQSTLYDEAGNVQFFVDALDVIRCAVTEAEFGDPAMNGVPRRFFGLFSKIGKGLNDGDFIELDPSNRDAPAVLNAESVDTLTKASQVAPDAVERTVRGSISEMDQARMKFELQEASGRRITCAFDEPKSEAILDAFVKYKQNEIVKVTGKARLNESQNVERLISISEMSALDPSDIGLQWDRLRGLKNGWYDGAGKAPSIVGLAWLERKFDEQYPFDELVKPRIYPTPEGGVQVEWSAPHHSLSLEVFLHSHEGEWHEFNLDARSSGFEMLDLDDDDHWSRITGSIRALSKIQG